MTRDRLKTVVLLSGGMDSAVCATIARKQGFALYALTVNYGQRHAAELKAAHRVGQAIGVEHHVVQTVDLRAFGGSALTDDIEVPKSRDTASGTVRIPATYVPARNTIFLALALAYSESIGSKDIFLGVNAIDYSGYPDCRPDFINAFTNVANLATRAGTEGVRFKIHTPLMNLSKADIVREGRRLAVDFSLTHSCYDPTGEGVACGLCDSCFLRLRGFEEAGVQDPLRYEPTART